MGGALLSLTGCGFFPAQTRQRSVTPINTGDYLYVGNAGNVLPRRFFRQHNRSPFGSNDSPYNNGVAVASLAVTPNNAYLYAGTTSGIFEYLINSNGSLTIQNNGAAVAQDVIATNHAGRFNRQLSAGVGAGNHGPGASPRHLSNQ